MKSTKLKKGFIGVLTVLPMLTFSMPGFAVAHQGDRSDNRDNYSYNNRNHNYSNWSGNRDNHRYMSVNSYMNSHMKGLNKHQRMLMLKFLRSLTRDQREDLADLLRSLNRHQRVLLINFLRSLNYGQRHNFIWNYRDYQKNHWDNHDRNRNEKTYSRHMMPSWFSNYAR